MTLGCLEVTREWGGSTNLERKCSFPKYNTTLKTILSKICWLLIAKRCLLWFKTHRFKTKIESPRLTYLTNTLYIHFLEEFVANNIISWDIDIYKHRRHILRLMKVTLICMWVLGVVGDVKFFYRIWDSSNFVFFFGHQETLELGW